MNTQEVLKLISDKGAQVIDLSFGDFPGTWHTSPSPPAKRRPISSRRVLASTAPAFVAGRRYTRATCW